MNALKNDKTFRLSIKIQWLITGILLVVMAVTRTDYFPNILDASWAVFFLIGFYLRSFIGLPIIIFSAVIVDFAMISARGGHQDYYLTPSYLFIIPAYAALWYAGRFLANHYSENFKGFLVFISSAIVGVVVCDLISSGGFYWMSTNYIELSMQEFISRTTEFLPQSLKVTLLYLSIATIIHLAFIQITKFSRVRDTRNT